MILTHLAGKWGAKSEENEGFGSLGPMGPLGAPMGVPWELRGSPEGPMGPQRDPLGPHGSPMGAQGGAHRAPWAPAWGPMGPLGPRGYIGKLPINHPNGGVLVFKTGI